MEQYRVSWALQHQAAAAIAAGVAVMDNLLGEVDAEYKKLVGSWVSDSEEVYENRQREWTAAANTIKSVCGQFQAAMNNSADIASTTEKTNVDLMSA